MASGLNIWADASAALPLPTLMRQLGDGIHVPAKFGGESKAPRCPFCEGEGGKWWVRQFEDGRFSFGCFKTSCRANDPEAGNGEIGYLALKDGLSRRDAAKRFLEMALPDREKEHPKAAQEKGIEPNPARQLKGGPWHELWKKLPLIRDDIEAIAKKRGLTHETLELCGVRSNNSGNRELVVSLEKEFPELELMDLGIFKPDESGTVKPAGQLFGWGRTGEHTCRECRTVFAGKRCPKCDRKPRSEDAVWSPDVEPPMIPYFGFDGTALYLRPHKGGVTNLEEKFIRQLEIADEEDERHECASHVYVPPNFAELLAASDGTAIFTEGEWKVMANVQCEIPAIACPGITFIRNPAFREELLGIIRHYGIRNLIVIFDNEHKGNPALPGYNPDPWKQHDTQLYAEYTQQDLFGFMRSRGGSIKVGRLPDALRDANGKADFDGILGKLVAEKGVADGTKAARKIFRKAMSEATENPGAGSLFPGDVRRIIERKLHLLRSTKVRLPFGGYPEAELAKRLGEWDAVSGFSMEAVTEDEVKPHHVDKMMADCFASVDGCYYERKQFLDKDARKETLLLLASVEGKIKAARGGKAYAKLKFLYSYQRALRERLKGKPVQISTATLKGEFKLRTPGGDTVRLVRIFDQRNRRKDSPLYRLSKDDAAQPSRLREWFLGHGRGTWGSKDGGGQGACDALNADLDDHVYLRDIHSVTHCGHHEDTGMWFYGDGAIIDDRSSKEGRSIAVRPDVNGVFWNPNDGVGYLLDANVDGSMSTFALGLPKLFGPQRGEDDRSAEALFEEGGLGDLLQTYAATHFHDPVTKPVRDLLLSMAKGEAKPSIDAALAAATPDLITVPDPSRLDPVTAVPMNVQMSVRDALETELARLVFQHLRDELLVTIGDHDAWLALGTVLNYALGPELVQEHLCHPGLFFVGGFGSGKTATALRLSRIWGQKDNASVDLSKTTTANALIRTLAQYSSITLVLDEYRRGTSGEGGNQKERDDLLRAATQRTQSHKATIASRTSTISIPPRTSPLVCGENSPQDSATASRYVHLTFSKARRRAGSDEAWGRVKQSSGHYYHLGRWLMMRRAGFARRVMNDIRAWMSSADTNDAIQHDRVQLTHGAAFCGFTAAADLLGVPLGKAATESFRHFTIRHAKKSLADVRDETFRNRFWRDIINALNRSMTGIKPRFFGRKHIMMTNADGSEVGPEMFITTSQLRDGMLKEKKPIGMRVTTPKEHQHAIPVVFVAAEELYNEWLRDLSSRRETCPISFANLRAEIEREPYFIPTPRNKKRYDDVHWQRLKDGDGEEGSKRYACWCISLGHSYDENLERGDQVFPFAHALNMALEAPQKDSPLTDRQDERSDSEE